MGNSNKKISSRTKNVILAILFLALGFVSGYYFLEFNYKSTKTGGINELHKKGFINELTAFTEGVLISKDDQKIKIDNNLRGVESFKLKDKSLIKDIEEGDKIRVEFMYDFDKQMFLVKKVSKI